MSMSNRLKALLLSSAVIALSVSSVAQARNYEPHGEAAYTGVVYEIHLVSGGQAVNPAILKADLDYVGGMREHHAGALTMSEDYLAKGANPVLRGMANAIITNQRFEIAVLDEVRRHVEQSPKVLADFGARKLVLRPVATEGLEHRMTFMKAPPPSAVDHVFSGGATVDEYDVKWAKAMIVHHQGALDMARAYNADPNGRNRFLRLMNLDIIQDQTYEIGFLERLIGRYSGDVAAVELDPSMVHGMLLHGGHEAMGHGSMDHGSMGH